MNWRNASIGAASAVVIVALLPLADEGRLAIMLTAVLGASLVPVVYSYLYWRRTAPRG